jgi:hypothetical protein
MKCRGTSGGYSSYQVELAIPDLRRQHFVDFFDHQPQVEGERFDGHAPGFDFREVENVVDHAEQAFARPPHGFGVVALLGRQLRIEQQPRHPDHAVHGSADLMAHVGQKLALGSGGRALRNP